MPFDARPMLFNQPTGENAVQEKIPKSWFSMKRASLALAGLIALAFTVILSVAESPAPPPVPTPPTAQTAPAEGSKPATPTPPPVTPPAPAPTYHALLIGVGKYQNLAERYQLKDGPGNDVTLMRDVLLQRYKGFFSPERITVLADGVEGSVGDPTRAAILKELTNLSEQVKPGDFAVVYYSGHGSQQTVTDQTAANEPDGRDEILLPSDVGNWNDTADVVENAIIDNEIETRLTALRQRGAFVLAVFDSCHSATVTRNAPPEDWRDRGIEPEDLGIPAAALNKATARGADGAGVSEAGHTFAGITDAGATGGYVAFFAAQSNETAPQLRLPQSDPRRQTHGLLTYTLASALAQLPEGVSYRQVGEQVARQYVADRFNSPTPAFEGDRLDAPVFGQKPDERVRQWPVKRNDAQLSIAAGTLHGLAEDALLVVVAGPVANEPLGYLKVTSLDLMSSQLVPTQPKDIQKPAIDPTQIPPGAYARLLSSPTRLTLRVAPPLEESQLPPKTSYTAAERQARTTLLEALTKAATQTEGLRIELTQPTNNADVLLRLQDGNLWLLDPGAELVTAGPRKSPSIAVTNTGALAGIVETHLQPLAKALSLLRLTAQLGEAASALQLEVKLWRKAQGAADFQEIDSKPGAAATFNPSDQLKMTFKNAGREPLDVTVLFIDSRYGVTAVYPGSSGYLNRLLPGNQDEIKGDINADTTGQERMLIIATKAETGMPASNFTYLAQAGVPATVKKGPEQPVTRGSTRGEVLAVEDILLRAVFGQSAIAQRGFGLTTPTSETVILRELQWQVAAPSKPASPTN